MCLIRVSLADLEWTPRCGASKLVCLQDAIDVYSALEDIEQCGCLAACNSITYDADISDVRLNPKDFYNETVINDKPGQVVCSHLTFAETKQ